jgi:import receptor subunit TOM22
MKEAGVLARVDGSMVKKQGLFMAKKPAKSTGKAAWITGTTFIVLVLPLLIAMDREYQLNELDLPERSLLGVPIHN